MNIENGILRMLRFLWIILLTAVSTDKLMAQDPFYTSKRNRKILVIPEAQDLDSMTVIPKSVQIFSLPGEHLLDSSYYFIQNSRILWRRPAADLPERIRATYRVLPYNLAKALARFDRDSVKLLTDAGKTVVGFNYNPYAKDQELIDFQGFELQRQLCPGHFFRQQPGPGAQFQL